jgi:hypothetical protein
MFLTALLFEPTMITHEEYLYCIDFNQYFGSSLTLCWSGFNFLSECGSGSSLKKNADPDPGNTLKTKILYRYFLCLKLLSVFLLRFPFILALFRPLGTGSAYEMRIQIRIQAAIDWEYNADPEPKHWFECMFMKLRVFFFIDARSSYCIFFRNWLHTA